MPKPLISVIIPAHNSEKTVSAAIVSMAKQTYAPLEIIVVDDNSEDGTEEIVKPLLKEYPNLAYYKLPVNDNNRSNERGRNVNAGYAARNYGFLQSKGEWITFQDADDMSLANRIEVQYDLALLHNASHVCVEWQQCKDEYLGKKLDVEAFLKEKGANITSRKEIIERGRKAKGILMALFGKGRSFVPFKVKTMRIVNRLFFGTLLDYPGSGNSPLFKREIMERVKFRPRDERIWPSFTGRGADRDFNFEVALTFKNSLCFLLPLYLWRVDRQNTKCPDASNYIR